jgi:RNA polymerase sigma-70 factor (ECF subfamily)
MQAWPSAWVPEEDFRAYVAERTAEGPPAHERDLDALYLACACVRGVPDAIKAFETSYVVEIRRAGERARLTADGVNELAQVLRQELLVGREGGRPKLAEYGGRGDLRGWLKVTAMRAALKVKKRSQHDAAAPAGNESMLLELRSAGDDPELSYMKALYGDAFRAAFRTAAGSLDPRDKNLLRQHFVEGRTIDELGTLYGVHRATAARWIQGAREKLLAATRREFAHRAQVSPRECESVLRLVQSKFDVTLRRLLS